MENVNPNLLHNAGTNQQHHSGVGFPIKAKPSSLGAARDRLSGDERRPRVLLLTEKADEVFLLDEGSREVGTRRKLADGVLAEPDNPGVWWELLKHVQSVFGSDPGYRPRLHKLFLKATRVIPEQIYNDDWSYTSIWVGFAMAERDASEQDCREAFQHMGRMGIGRSHAALYSAWATFENGCGRSAEAMSIIERGMAVGAKPTNVLQECLARLRGAPCTPAPSVSTRAAAAGTGGGLSSSSAAAMDTPSPPLGPTEVDADSTVAMQGTPPDGAHTAIITLRNPQGLKVGRGQTSAGKPPRQMTLGSLDLSCTSSSSSSSSSSPSGDTVAFDGAASDAHNQTGNIITMRDQDDGLTGNIHFGPGLPPHKADSRAPPPQPVAPPVTQAAAAVALPPPSSAPPRAPLAERPRPSDSPSASSSTTTAKPAPIRRWQQPSGLLGHGRATRVRATSEAAVAAAASSAASPRDSNSGSSSTRGMTGVLQPALPPPATSLTHLTPISEDPTLPSQRASEGPSTRSSTDPADHRGSLLGVTGAAGQHALERGSLDNGHRASSGSSLSESASNKASQWATPSDRTLPHGGATQDEHQRHQDDLSLTRDRGRQPRQPGGDVPTLAHGGDENTRGSGATTSKHSSASGGGGSGTDNEQPPQQQQRFSFASLLNPKNFLTVNGMDYLRLDVLGRGGSSKVFRVLSDSGQVYALKRVRVQPGDHRALESFANEITLLTRLKGHPSIIQLVDSLVDRRTGVVLMLMELGETDLNKLLQKSAAEERGRQLSLNFIRYTWEQMLRAVQCAHEERIVHGDLKPANFVFVRGRLKLIDFGIAKAIGNDTTNIMRENQVGTVNYMSPEAILDTGKGAEHPVTGRKTQCMKLGRQSDVWSLGCILYQMVYNKTPFADLSLIHKLQAITDESYAIPFPTLEPTPLHPAVHDTITICLRRDPSSRATVAALLTHPFLTPSSTSTAGSADSVQQVVGATLNVLDRDRDILQIAPHTTRLATLTRRVNGELARAPLSSPPGDKSSSRSHQERAHMNNTRAAPPPRTLPTSSSSTHAQLPPSSSSRATAATAGSSSSLALQQQQQRPRGAPLDDLSEQIRSQRTKLRPVTESERQRRPGKQPPRGGELGLYTMLEQDLQHKFRLAHNRDDTNGSSTQENSATWSFC